MVKRLLGLPRYMMVVAIVCLLIASAVLLLVGIGETFYVLLAIFGETPSKTIQIEVLSLVDSFLLVTILLIFASGLYTLFLDDDLPVPEWLKPRDIDDLKVRLIGGLLVFLATSFASDVVRDAGGSETFYQDLLLQGLAIAAVSLPLAWIVVSHRHKHDGMAVPRPAGTKGDDGRGESSTPG